MKFITAEEARKLPLKKGAEARISDAVAAINAKIQEKSKTTKRALIGFDNATENVALLSDSEQQSLKDALKACGYKIIGEERGYPNFLFMVDWSKDSEDNEA